MVVELITLAYTHDPPVLSIHPLFRQLIDAHQDVRTLFGGNPPHADVAGWGGMAKRKQHLEEDCP